MTCFVTFFDLLRRGAEKSTYTHAHTHTDNGFSRGVVLVVVLLLVVVLVVVMEVVVDGERMVQSSDTPTIITIASFLLFYCASERTFSVMCQM